MYGRRRYYGGDPYWTTARFNSVCNCGCVIHKGQPIFYYPRSRTALCETCGRRGDADLQDEILNEQFHIR